MYKYLILQLLIHTIYRTNLNSFSHSSILESQLTNFYLNANLRVKHKLISFFLLGILQLGNY